MPRVDPLSEVVEDPRIQERSDAGEFYLDVPDGELSFYDEIAREQIGLSGAEIVLYMLSEATTKDPLYGEYVNAAWDEYELRAFVEYQESMFEVREEGHKRGWPSSVWIPRVDLESLGARYPKPGDVVGFWDLSFFRERSTLRGTGTEPKGYFFNVEDVNEDGHIHDQGHFTGFKLALTRNTEFTPERRVRNT